MGGIFVAWGRARAGTLEGKQAGEFRENGVRSCVIAAGSRSCVLPWWLSGETGHLCSVLLKWRFQIVSVVLPFIPLTVDGPGRISPFVLYNSLYLFSGRRGEIHPKKSCGSISVARCWCELYGCRAIRVGEWLHQHVVRLDSTPNTSTGPQVQ